MVFGKIEYLNLLPFHVFMKRFTKNSSAKIAMHYKGSVPAKINTEFHAKRVDAAFISSIKAKKAQHIQLGIIAKKDVKSVLVIPSNTNRLDKESASSNILLQVLGLEGEVLIGDKALHYALQNPHYIDLAQQWHDKYKLPFVFALLCYHKEPKLYKKIEKDFLKTKVKIPQYILKNAAKKTKISPHDILEYLQLISYKLDTKAQMGLNKFYKLAKKYEHL